MSKNKKESEKMLTTRTYNKAPQKDSTEHTVLTAKLDALARQYGLTSATEASTLLTIVYQLAHNNTIGWSVDDITHRIEVLLKAARRSVCEHSDYCTK